MPPLRNDWAAWQFDGAVLWEGLTIENAANEREEYGPANARQSRAKYELSRLLEPDYRLRPADQQQEFNAMVQANPGIVGHWKQKNGSEP